MSTKEEKLDLLKFAIEQMGDFRMYLEFKDNVIKNMATTNDLCTLHEVEFRKAPWATW